MKIIKRIAAILAGVMLAAGAHAVQLEIGLGGTVAQPVGNGGWYQEGLPHTLNLRSQTWMVGVTDDLAPGWAWHAQLVHLGHFSSDAMACDRDEDYDPVAMAPRPTCNVARYRGAGSVLGLAATIERYTIVRGWRLGAEAGPLLFEPAWSGYVDGWKASPESEPTTITWRNPGNPKLGAVVGMSVGRGPWGLSLRQYWDKCTPSTDACLWRTMRTLMLTYRF